MSVINLISCDNPMVVIIKKKVMMIFFFFFGLNILKVFSTEEFIYNNLSQSLIQYYFIVIYFLVRLKLIF